MTTFGRTGIVTDAVAVLYDNDFSGLSAENVQDAIDEIVVFVGGISAIEGLTGDVTATGPGVVAATIVNDAVTYAKMQNVSATDRLLGRSSLGSGDVEEIICTAAGRAILDDADAATQRSTLGLGTLATQSGTFSGTSSGTNTGDQTLGSLGGQPLDSTLTALAAYNTDGFLVQTAADTFVGRSFADSATVTWTNPAGLAGNPSAALNTSGIDHNGLTNLTVGDVHTQYALLAGRSGGQTLKGDTASGGNLTLTSTNHATKGKIIIDTMAIDEANTRIGIGTTSPASIIDATGTITGSSGIPTGYSFVSTVTPTGVAAYGILNQPTINNDTTNSYGFYNNVTFQIQEAGFDMFATVSHVTVGGSSAFNPGSVIASRAQVLTGASFTGSITNGRCYNATNPILNGSGKITTYTGFFCVGVGSSATANSGNTSGTLTNACFHSASHTAASGVGGTINNIGVNILVPNGSGASGTTNNYGLKITNNSTSGDTNYAIYSDSTCASYLAGNLGIGTTTFGASLAGGMAMLNGTAATGNVTDCFQHYAADQAAGNSCPHWRTENGAVVKLYNTATYVTTNPSADRSWNAGSAALAEVRNVLSTLIADLGLTGIITST